jgi:hypothetical protein
VDALAVAQKKTQLRKGQPDAHARRQAQAAEKAKKTNFLVT